MKTLCFSLFLISLCVANRAPAQCSSAPPPYSAACTEMQGYLSSYNATLSSQWNGAKSSAVFGTELLAANDNIGLTGLLAPNALSKVQMELDGMSKVGVQFVTVAVSFPILYQPFYSFETNNPQDYAQVLTFYQNVMAQIHQRGMKVLIETFVVFPAYATDLPLNDYYKSLTTSQFNAGRAQNAQNVAQLLQPDWLNLGSEPDTESVLIGLKAEYTPQQWATEISTIVTQLRSAGISGKPLVGAGCGAWQQNGADYVQALMSTGIDYFDMHTFSVNLGMLNTGQMYLDTAIAAGKGTAISEAWDHKLTDAQLQVPTEFGIINELAAAEPYNAYSFGATQDAEFLGELIGLAYWKRLLYVSPFESEIFFAYVNYNLSSSLSAPDLTTAETKAESAALANGTMSSLGLWYAAAIKPVNAATISAASGVAPVAPASIVSIYGLNMAATSEAATTQPLPTTLAGASAIVTDANGVETPLPLFFASPKQINAEIPASANLGPAVITITTPSGALSSPVVLNPVAPGLFTADESGSGFAAAYLITNTPNGQLSTLIANCAGGSCTGVPLDVSSGKTALELWGTGIQNRASLSDVTVTIGNQTLAAAYAGPAPGFIGEDQINVDLPSNLAGSGTANITVTVSGSVSNVVRATFQ